MYGAEWNSAMNTPIPNVPASAVVSLELVEEGIGTALNLAGVGVWEHCPAAHTFACSDGFFHLVGIDPAVGRQTPDFWRRRCHPDESLNMDRAYQDFVAGATPSYEETYRIRHDSGEWISVLARARWVAAASSSPCILGYVIDVTARTAEVDSLRVREERFRLSLSALHGMLYDFDLRTKKCERHGLAQFLGYDHLPSEEGDGYGGWMEIVHPDDQERVSTTIVRQRELGQDYEITYRVRHLDGHWRYVSQRSTYLIGAGGKVVRSFGIIEDVTEAYDQREQLLLQASVIRRMSEGVMVINRAGIIRFTNPAFDHLYGYEPGALHDKDSHLLSFRTRAHFDGLLKTAFDGTADDRTSVIDMEGRQKDGTMVPVQGCISAMQFGGESCVIVVMSDITERKRLEREVMQVATRVQQRIGSDLHDGLGQQLAGIAMMLQGVAQKAHVAGNPTLRHQVEEVVELVNGAITSTRSLARGLSPVRASRDGLAEGFTELVNQIFERYRARVDLDMRLPEQLRLDEDTATNIYRIAQEAVLNAVRHGDPENLQLKLRVTGPDVELLVIDDGKGFEPQSLAQGMGLRIMRFRAQLVGGYLSIESRPGAGTTIRCRCPAQLAKEAA
jgi:PAS domain S-box-containing protein